MRRYLILFASILVFSAVPVMAQTTVPVKPDEQARLKPLLDGLSKAQESFVGRRDALPESKAVVSAQATLQKAIDAQKTAAEKLPEFDSVRAAEAKVLDEIYRILAEHKLSSREYRPTINDKGELAFTKIESAPTPKAN